MVAIRSCFLKVAGPEAYGRLYLIVNVDNVGKLPLLVVTK